MLGSEGNPVGFIRRQQAPAEVSRRPDGLSRKVLRPLGDALEGEGTGDQAETSSQRAFQAGAHRQSRGGPAAGRAERSLCRETQDNGRKAGVNGQRGRQLRGACVH